MDQLREAIEKDLFILDIKGKDIRTIFQRAITRMVDRETIPQDQAEKALELLVAREEESSTALGQAIGVPHAYLDGLTQPVILFARLADPLNLGAPDGIPTRFLFFLLGPPGASTKHLDSLASIARLASDDEFRFDAQIASGKEDLLGALNRFRRRTEAPREKPKPVDDGLVFTRRPFGGFMGDLRRRLPHYVADIKDGLHPKCVGATLFLFFACLAPAVTFGGVMALQTGKSIGAVEMIAASAICGLAYAIFSGQPLIILGGTGPLLVFTAVLYRLCGDMEIPFLSTYAWVGIWSAGLLIILAASDASYLMRYFTRFTDETFAALISVIFIYEAIKNLLAVFGEAGEGVTSLDAAFLSVLLALGTFYVAMSLSRFRRSKFLLPKAREFLADFGPTIALASMTGVAIYFAKDVNLASLAVPEKLSTTSGRPWTVDIFEAPMWVRFATIVPAILVCVLVYLDQNITARLVNSPDHKLKKGAAYHLDLLVVGVLMGFCSLFGLPWLVAATVRSLNHVRSLATTEEVVKKDGTVREEVLSIRETRVTGFCIHFLIGLSLFLLPLLKHIPMAVLYGVFLFMGVASMAGNQFFERLSLWIMDSTLYPTTHYTRRVPAWTIHKFTLLQLVSLAVLWVVKTSALAILFPLFIAILVPIRLLANRFFEPYHLAALDAEEDPESEEEHWL